MDITCDYLAWRALKESGVPGLYTTHQQARHRNKENGVPITGLKISSLLLTNNHRMMEYS